MGLRERYQLANELLAEYRQTVSDLLVPRGLSPTLWKDASPYRLFSSPYEALENGAESVLIHGDQASKKRWLDVLPQLDSLEEATLWTTGISEELLAAICRRRTLRRLWFESTRLETLEVLTSARDLTRLSIGSSPRVSSLHPVSQLHLLVALGIEGDFPSIRDLSGIKMLTHLRGLSVCGQDYKDLRLESLEDVRSMENLEYLSLAAVRVEHDGLSPLADLPRLEYLYLDPHHLHAWSKADFQLLHEAKPNLRGTLIGRAATDRAFQRIMGIR